MILKNFEEEKRKINIDLLGFYIRWNVKYHWKRINLMIDNFEKLYGKSRRVGEAHQISYQKTKWSCNLWTPSRHYFNAICFFKITSRAIRAQETKGIGAKSPCIIQDKWICWRCKGGSQCARELKRWGWIRSTTPIVGKWSTQSRGKGRYVCTRWAGDASWWKNDCIPQIHGG